MGKRVSKKPQVPSTDRTIPPYKADVDLEPNYYCRGRNKKRGKYCRSRAGAKTDHPGVGRCKFHGGTNQNASRMKTGQRAMIVHPTIVKLLEKHAADGTTVKDKMLAALNHTLALRDYAIEKYQEKPTEQLLSLIAEYNENISKSGYRLEQIRSHGTISIDRIKLFMLGIYSVLEADIADPELRGRVKKSIAALRV